MIRLMAAVRSTASGSRFVENRVREKRGRTGRKWVEGVRVGEGGAGRGPGLRLFNLVQGPIYLDPDILSCQLAFIVTRTRNDRPFASLSHTKPTVQRSSSEHTNRPHSGNSWNGFH
jgi:hypothetical protein